MTGRGKVSKKNAGKTQMAPKEPATKLQKKVIHWVRNNVPTKTTKFLHAHKVTYFTGSKAVDALVNDSPWSKAKAKEGQELVFNYRESAIEFMDEMLKHKMFHRAVKIPVVDKPKKKKGGKKDGGGGDGKTDTEKEETEGGTTPKPKGDGGKDGRKKRKIRLDMHLDQVFLDSTDAYVWLYDPIPWYYWVGGTAIVLGIIAVCLFPLWPPMMRKGVHYLSVAAAGFLIFIIGLGVIKYIIFGILFALSGGKLKFWIFPNLTEDVGFLESFVPLYDYTYTGVSWLGRKKAKDSDDEEEDDSEEEEEEDDEKSSRKGETGKQGDNSGEESDESTSRKSSTGKDFEMVDKNNEEDTDH